MSTKKMSWPDLTGLRIETGLVCVGRQPSRSQAADTLYLFMRPPTKGTLMPSHPLTLVPPHHVGELLGEVNPHNASVLANALRDAIQSKPGVVPFERGGVVTQCVSGGRAGPRMWLMEAGPHGALYPRYTYALSHAEGLLGALWKCIREEVSHPGILCGEPDNRLAVELESWSAFGARQESGHVRLVQAWVKVEDVEPTKEMLRERGHEVR